LNILTSQWGNIKQQKLMIDLRLSSSNLKLK
jgi:hypothetical protein